MTNLLRLPAVMERTGLSKPTIYHRIKLGLLPMPVKNGERISVWPSDELDVLIKAYTAGETEDAVREIVAGLIQSRRKLPLA